MPSIVLSTGCRRGLSGGCTFGRTQRSMASIHQVRGVLLEEAVLMLLRAAGYGTVTDAGNDPTLRTSASGLTVRGRGTCHQLDAIADLRIGQPFSNPQRLLVEAKSYSDHRPIGLPIVRGTVGVLKDVSEFWVAEAPGRPAAGRYHYQAAVFSSSDFTSDAQDYAFAHDVHLLPLARSTYFTPVIDALDVATQQLPTREGQVMGVALAELRKEVRRRLQPELRFGSEMANLYPWLDIVVASTRAVGQSLIATLGHAFPVFLTPSRNLNLDDLSPVEDIEIHFGAAGIGNGWTISKPGGERLFTFDLPNQLFELYATNGVLSRRSAASLKAAYLGEFTAIYAPHDRIKVFNFRLAPGWLDEVRANLERDNTG